MLGVGGTSALDASGTASARPPELMLGVYAYDDTLLGYLVAQSLGGSCGSWGGLTVSDGGLEDALALARRTARALDLLGVVRGAHHCLCTVSSGVAAAQRARREVEFLDALQPLARLGLVRTVYREGADGLEASFAREAAAASTATSVVVALQSLHLDPAGATFVVDDASPHTGPIVQALVERGLRRVAAAAHPLSSQADVLLAGASPRPIDLADAAAVRARVILPLGATRAAVGVAERLHERRITLLPDTLPIAGMLAALDYRSRGVPTNEALERATAMLEKRLRTLFREAEEEAVPVGVVAAAAEVSLHRR